MTAHELRRAFEAAGFYPECLGGNVYAYSRGLNMSILYVADRDGEGLPRPGEPCAIWIESGDGRRHFYRTEPTPEAFLRDFNGEA